MHKNIKIVITSLLLLLTPSYVFATTLYSHVGAGGECCTVDGVGGTNEKYSQTFTTASDYTLVDADLWASSQGGLDGLRMVIYADSGGFPTGSALDTSSTGTGWSSGSLNSQTVTFNNVCIPAGTYDFVIERTSGRSTVLNWVLGIVSNTGSGDSILNSGVWSVFSGGNDYIKSEIRGTATTCGGGGGGGSNPSTPVNVATSTADQTQTNTAYGFGILIASIWLTLYIFKRR